MQNKKIRLYSLYSHNKHTLSNSCSLLDRVRLSHAFGTECELTYTQPQKFIIKTKTWMDGWIYYAFGVGLGGLKGVEG